MCVCVFALEHYTDFIPLNNFDYEKREQEIETTNKRDESVKEQSTEYLTKMSK